MASNIALPYYTLGTEADLLENAADPAAPIPKT
jgi:hypothetical protein